MPLIAAVMIAINRGIQRSIIGKLPLSLVSVFHTTLQRRRIPSMTTSKFVGIPIVVETCNNAPVSETFLYRAF